MKNIFIVLDALGDRTRNPSLDCEETFDSRKAAECRAEELAALYPGQEIEIYQRVAVALASVNKPLITEE